MAGMPGAEVWIWLASVWLVAAVTPGPNTFAVLHVAARHGRAPALAAAAGTVAGTALWAGAGFFGLAVLFAAVPQAAQAIKLAGAAYLIWVGIGLWRGAWREGRDLAVPGGTGAWRRAFLFGLATNLANPKTAAFAASIFAVALPPGAGIGASLGAVALVCAISASWYGVLALAGSGARAVRLWQAGRRWILRGTGVLFGGYGAALAAEGLAGGLAGPD